MYAANDNSKLQKALEMLNEATKNYANGIISMLEKLTELGKRHKESINRIDERYKK